ncbi:ribosomal-processing cysteine protease Prp [Lysinibacillus sp. NPDC047702]|uniref:ribosomal-processing cysteine protease Prp n=1 Tax=unclassified Lysinibacillus TaxID=2636778 RepID=UPI003D019253
MIQVTIHHDENRHVSAFEYSGHANYEDSGKDLVCASASTIAMYTVNVIFGLTNVEPKIDQALEGGGYLKVDLPTDLPQEIDMQIQLVLQVMTAQVYSIVEKYPEFIRVKYELVGGGTE